MEPSIGSPSNHTSTTPPRNICKLANETLHVLPNRISVSRPLKHVPGKSGRVLDVLEPWPAVECSDAREAAEFSHSCFVFVKKDVFVKKE